MTPTSFYQLVDLEQVAADFFVGQSPDYPWGRVYGGQVVAQALAAAAATVNPGHRVHSLHAYFVLGGQPLKPILFEVDRLREGKSFTTRRVVARQSSGAILNLDASFQRDEPDVDLQTSGLPADCPLPDELDDAEWPGFAEVREVPASKGVSRSRIWMRMPTTEASTSGTATDSIRQACALAYMSDHNPMDAIVTSHPGGFDFREMMTASLDHNVWFHREGRADEWMLFDLAGHGLINARGLATGTVHSIDGVHLATIAQEGLVRSPRS